MSRPCPNCGAACATEARFCRLCGTPLKAVGGQSVPVNPGAVTVPLSDEGRTTKGLSAEDGSASAPDTRRVKRAEMDSILRRPVPPPPSQQETDGAQVLTDTEAPQVPSTTALSNGADGASRAQEPPSSGAQASSTEVAPEEKASAVEAATDEGRGAKSSAVKKRPNVARRAWLAASLALLVVAVGVVALAFYYSRGGRGAQGAATGSASDQRRLVEEKLAEAEKLMAEGNTTDAIARLRAALRLDPSNAKAHRMLAEALERTGAVGEAIDEYRAATQKDPNDEATWLRYADALRRVGRTEEAREIYQRLSSSSSEGIARAAKEQLAALPPAPLSTSNTEPARAQNRAEENVAKAGSALPPTSAESGAPPASANASGGAGAGGSSPKPQNDPVASYNAAMKIIEGKKIKKMSRADLIRAYELFQYAQRGPNAADATRHLNELDKELFERRKRK